MTAETGNKQRKRKGKKVGLEQEEKQDPEAE
jgi:hypothetical protein